MRDLIKALEIFTTYCPDAGTQAQHDVFAVNVDPEYMSKEDVAKLKCLGFIPGTHEWEGCFISFRWGSC